MQKFKIGDIAVIKYGKDTAGKLGTVANMYWQNNRFLYAIHDAAGKFIGNYYSYDLELSFAREELLQMVIDGRI